VGRLQDGVHVHGLEREEDKVRSRAIAFEGCS
jgi:hypothetical protein